VTMVESVRRFDCSSTLAGRVRGMRSYLVVMGQMKGGGFVWCHSAFEI
jgi:uncharacterized protein (DUF1786 family)